MKKVILETAKRAVKENDKEMKIALMNRYPDNKQIWKILFGKRVK